MAFMTSHLESTKDYTTERTRQLRKSFGIMEAVDTNRTTIFGGDLNLRDKEVHFVFCKDNLYVYCGASLIRIIQSGNGGVRISEAPLYTLYKEYTVLKYILSVIKTLKKMIQQFIQKMNGLFQLQCIGGPPKGVVDVWEASGQRPEAAYTWDLTRNDNLKFGGSFKPRFRFDRLYMRHSQSPTIDPVYTELIGLERIKNCGRFPSDHWGILTHYNILSKMKNLAKK